LTHNARFREALETDRRVIIEVNSVCQE
jgi:hypothetical protein